MALKRITPATKEISACAIFGAISYSMDGGQPKPLSGRLAVDGICSAEVARGGTFGNGFLAVSPRKGEGKNIVVWAREKPLVDEISRRLSEGGIAASEFQRQGEGEIYVAQTSERYSPLTWGVIRANSLFGVDEARIISFGHGMMLYKGLGSLSELDGIYGLGGMRADAFIAHTRYPTGSSAKVVRAHPFGFGNVGIVHNGDVTSYTANLAACEALLAVLYSRDTKNGVREFLDAAKRSWVGTDSEVIAAMLCTLLKAGRVMDPALSLSGAMEVLVPSFDNHLTRLLRGTRARERLERLRDRYQKFALDGPVSCIATIATEDEVRLLAFQDRNMFRPLQVVVDKKNRVVYVASEGRQIRDATGLDLSSQDIEHYSPDPGKYLLVSSRSGIISSGKTSRTYISVPQMPPCAVQINGEPSQLAGSTVEVRNVFCGIGGNHFGSYSNGNGSNEHFGSIENNTYEASSLNAVIVHGNVSIKTGNAFQGKRFYIRGGDGSRTFEQLRPSKDGVEPFGIIGEKAGPYLGKMMSGGTIMALNLQNLGSEDVDPFTVGDFLMTGAVRGKAYIRGDVPDESIGRPPSRRSVIAVCAALAEEGVITETAMREIRHNPLNLDRVLKIIEDHDDPRQDLRGAQDRMETAQKRLSPLFRDNAQLRVEKRQLDGKEIAHVGPYVREFCEVFGLDPSTAERVLRSSYTIVSAVPPGESYSLPNTAFEPLSGVAAHGNGAPQADRS